jgi:hypothetical protein
VRIARRDEPQPSGTCVINMIGIKKSLICTLCISLIGAAGCASQQAQPASSAPVATAAPTPPPAEISTHYEIGGPQLSIYRPNTRTLYLWSGDPRPGPTFHPMTCIKVQMSDSPSGGPMTEEPCS